jgi:hypothetical protein
MEAGDDTDFQGTGGWSMGATGYTSHLKPPRMKNWGFLVRNQFGAALRIEHRQEIHSRSGYTGGTLIPPGMGRMGRIVCNREIKSLEAAGQARIGSDGTGAGFPIFRARPDTPAGERHPRSQ